jgi:hypothetical protein
MSSSTVEAHKDELKDYDTSKGAIRFQADKPLPVALVRNLVKARIAENVGRRKNKMARRFGAADTGRHLLSSGRSAALTDSRLSQKMWA